MIHIFTPVHIGYHRCFLQECLHICRDICHINRWTKDDPICLQHFFIDRLDPISFMDTFFSLFENSIPGFSSGIRDTYSLDILGKAFETRAADTDVEYSFDYFYPVESSSVYYSLLSVKIEPVSSENLETVSTVLSQALNDTFEKVHDVPSYITINLTYREPVWPEDRSCLIAIVFAAGVMLLILAAAWCVIWASKRNFQRTGS